LLAQAKVVPLYFRAARVLASPELRGVAVDFAGRASLADVHRRPK
jgi:hypothetical protein